MAQVYVSIGSNIDRERNIRFAMDKLRAEYAPIIASSVYESDAVGFQGDSFFNLVVGFHSPDSPQAVFQTLRAIEDQCDRTRDGERYSSRTLDLDLLLYDDEEIREQGIDIPRDEILLYAFVLGPLAEIAGERRHPSDGRAFAELWAEFDKTGREIRIVPFAWSLDDNGPTP
uniref:2-amino-4-hydroxy-6-hydroxymethyldihydropteridine diphosphokinase n=1 Tax=Candidatus Kentrum sp. LPFa TaxID=2126335 RepID=A0A450X9D6_9GAMM|nr:MAG: 2-amino-4-hydroxy-6-hydroxymethyldihydropteridinediphosphokinase [Candidatus Kentron sp. LPFa]VFK25922.1 MAG: 2-amino-4-hydroxy-6-hydroxymethyldihydropteridinediphosphokinase [Candidatus Kentron sp. LPFa]